ncbi:hypothetical protein TNCV_2024981 [Trichonephila clavipes]|nr:hypothetical protein TNCV_2024981 [Trichonephila clavipes]
MATGSYLTPNYSRSQSEIQGDLHKLSVLSMHYHMRLSRCDIDINHDEAHFWLNGYVNKQNCRIWSEANPQVYVETPLHPEKLTVWCALWACGILLQKR